MRNIFQVMLSNFFFWAHYVTEISKLSPSPLQQSNGALREIRAENRLSIESGVFFVFVFVFNVSTFFTHLNVAHIQKDNF